jgi:uncharacterized protein (DUF1800 family)
MITNNCANPSLNPYSPPTEDWTEKKIRHLYQKFGFGATQEQVDQGLQMTPAALVDQLLLQATSSAMPPTPSWANWTDDDYDNQTEENLRYIHFEELKESWIQRAMEFPFQMKLSLFWHDHFATEYDVYGCNNYLWAYYSLIHQQSFGNFRTFVEQMGVTGAMLSYLNGNDNIADEPNENYARELMELFTMGEGNGYTQTDIEEVARALTGYRAQMYDCYAPYFEPNLHDNGVKTIFGQSGNFGYDDVHELIFSLRRDQTAKYICTKLYQLYVYFDPNPIVVNQLAETFKDNNWEIAPVIAQILKSEHFFDDSFVGASIKNPLELIMEMLVPLNLELGVDTSEGLISYIDYAINQLGQDLFNPPNVAGWSGHRTWLNENALTYRWTFCNTIIRNYLEDTGKEKLRQLALAITNESNDPLVIVMAMSDVFSSVELNQELIDVGTLYLKAGIPQNYFDDGSWNLYWDEAPDQLVNLISYFIQIPEFQLT